MIRIAPTCAAISIAVFTSPILAGSYHAQRGDPVHPEPGGIHMYAQGGGASWHIPFGTPFHQVMAALDTALGLDVTLAFQPECPAGPMIVADYSGRLSLVFQEDHLQSWSLPQQSPLITHDGIGWGSRQDHL